MDKAELMQKEIENKRKLPEEIKKDIKKKILHNLILALIIILYLDAVNILFNKLENNMFEKIMKFVALGIDVITVILFEIAYRRKSKRIFIVGIELLICSIFSLYVPYIYLFTNLKNVITICLEIIIIYYIIKAFIIFKGRQFEYQNNLSDVKEILKDSEKESYLEEESTKVFKEIQKYKTEQKEELIKEQKRIGKLKEEAKKEKIKKDAVKNEKAKKELTKKTNTNVKKDKTTSKTKSTQKKSKTTTKNKITK